MKAIGRKIRFLSWRYTPYLFLMPTVITLVLITIYPLLFSLWMSLNNYELGVPGGLVSFAGLQNFADALRSSLFYEAFMYTIIFTFGAVGIEFVLGIGIALLLTRKFKGLGFVRTIITLPMMVTPVAAGLIWKLIFVSFGLVNYFLRVLGLPTKIWLQDPVWSLPVCIVVDVWQWTPFMVLVFLAGLLILPSEPFEAAIIDGASRLQMFRHLTLPMLRHLILTVVLIRMMDALKAFDMIYVLTGGGPGNKTEVLSLHIYLTGLKWGHLGYAAAMSFIILIVIIVIAQGLFRTLGRE